MNLRLIPKIIDNNNFKNYGEIIYKQKNKSIDINNGFAIKFDDLLNINTSKYSGSTKFSIFSSKPRSFPMKIEMMERHPLGSQAFFPLSNNVFLVVVAPGKNIPEINKIEAFIVPYNTGINYNVGVWHYPLIATVESDFVVIERKGKEKNLEIFNFKNVLIELEYE